MKLSVVLEYKGKVSENIGGWPHQLAHQVSATTSSTEEQEGIDSGTKGWYIGMVTFNDSITQNGPFLKQRNVRDVIHIGGERNRRCFVFENYFGGVIDNLRLTVFGEKTKWRNNEIAK